MYKFRDQKNFIWEDVLKNNIKYILKFYLNWNKFFFKNYNVDQLKWYTLAFFFIYIYIYKNLVSMRSPLAN